MTAFLIVWALFIIYLAGWFIIWGWPSSVVTAWIFILPFIGSVIMLRLWPNIKLLRKDDREDWNFILSIFVAIFTIGGGLVAFSAVNSQATTHSSCFLPKGVNVTSPNCQIIETVTLPNTGAFAFYGGLGNLIVVAGLVGIWVFAIFFALLYLFHKISVP